MQQSSTNAHYKETLTSEEQPDFQLPEKYLQSISRRVNRSVFESCDLSEIKTSVSSTHVFVKTNKDSVSGIGLIPWQKFKVPPKKAFLNIEVDFVAMTEEIDNLVTDTDKLSLNTD